MKGKDDIISGWYCYLPGEFHEKSIVKKTLFWQKEFAQCLENPKWFCLVRLGEIISDVSSIKKQSWPYSREVNCKENWKNELIDLLGKDNADLFVISLPDVEFHPGAFYALAKACADEEIEIWISHEANIESAKVSFIRKANPDFYSMLSVNTCGSFVCVKRKTLNVVLEDGDLPQSPAEALWAIALRILSRKYNAATCGLYLGRSRVRNFYGKVSDEMKQEVIAASRKRNIDLLDWQVFGRGMKPCLLKEDSVSVDIVMPFRDEAQMTIVALKSLMKQTEWDNTTVILVDNGSSRSSIEEVKQFIEGAGVGEQIKIISDKHYFNFARLCNLGALKGRAQVIVFMNNDVELVSNDALSELSSWAMQREVGIVGGTLRYLNGDIQSAGIVFSPIRPANVSLQSQGADLFRRVSAVSLALGAVRRSVFEQMNMLDEWVCPNAYGDVLFGNKLVESGYLNLILPWVESIHKESISRGLAVEEVEWWEMDRQGVQIAALNEEFRNRCSPFKCESGQVHSHYLCKILHAIQRRPRLHWICERVGEVFFKAVNSCKGGRK